MADLKRKGDLAELQVATDLLRRGYRIALPYGEDAPYDLILDRGETLERVQVKHTCSDGAIVVAKCFSHSLTKGKIRATTRYTSQMIEWLAVYDATTDRCYYVPASQLGAGRSTITLRLTPALSGRQLGIHDAKDYLAI